MSSESPTYRGMKTVSDTNAVVGKNSNNLFLEIHKQWGHMKGNQGLNSIDQATQNNFSGSPLENVRKQAEVIGSDVVCNFGVEDEKKSPDRFCKTMRKTVKEISDRHDITLKAMVNKLNMGNGNTFQTFINVADEIFEDGQINWGRVIVVYAFAARLTAHVRQRFPDYEEKIALYVGKYVGNKLGHWILAQGGWDAFADFFSDQSTVEDKVWKGLLFTATLGGIGALAAVMAR